MAEIALGWLGWTEEQALSADVNAILVGHEGRLGMYETIGWIERDTPRSDDEGEGGHAISPELFDAVFG